VNSFETFYNSSVLSYYRLFLLDPASGLIVAIPKKFLEKLDSKYESIKVLSALKRAVFLNRYTFPIFKESLQEMTKASLIARSMSQAPNDFPELLMDIVNTILTYVPPDGNSKKTKARKRFLAQLTNHVIRYSGYVVIQAMSSKDGQKFLKKKQMEAQFFGGMESSDDYDEPMLVHGRLGGEDAYADVLQFSESSDYNYDYEDTNYYDQSNNYDSQDNYEESGGHSSDPPDKDYESHSDSSSEPQLQELV
jgi:hypothetical protein